MPNWEGPPDVYKRQLLQSAYDEYLKTREAIGRTKPINLMDMGTIVAKFLKQQGKLDKLDESEEINACTVKIDVEVEDRVCLLYTSRCV